MVNGLCQAYQSLPERGGVLDQPVSILRMHAILAQATKKSEPKPDPFAGIPMIALGGL
jgi:hypothetical protein